MAAFAEDAKVRVEVDLTEALNSLVVAEEGGCPSEVEIACLETELARVKAERESLLLELEVSKGEVSSLHARAGKDREDMVKDYQGSLELIFSYIAMVAARSRTTSMGTVQRSRTACLTLPAHFLQKNLSTQGAPLAPIAVEAKDAEVDQGRAIEDSEGGCCCQGIELSFIC